MINLLFFINNFKKLYKTIYFIIKKSMNFAKTFPKSRKLKQKYVFPLSNIENPKISFVKKKGELFVIDEASFLRKIWLSLKDFYFFHFIAILMDFLSIVIQNLYPYSCLLYPTCVCPNSFAIKIYTLIKELLSYWIMIIAWMFSTVFHLNEMDKKNLKILFLGLNLAIICYFYLKDNSPNEVSDNIFLIFLCLIGIHAFFNFIYLVTIKFDVKKFIIKFLKGSSLLYLICFNNYFFSMSFGSINKYLKTSIDYSLAQPVMRIFLIIYLYIFRYLGLKFLWLYSETITKETSIKSKRNLRISFWVRTIICYIYTLNILAIIRGEIFEWTSYFLFVEYFLFLIQGYTQYDFKKIILFKILGVFFPKYRKKISISKEKEFFRKILAGGLLDIQFICGYQLVILISLKRWSISRGVAIYSKNCLLEVSEKFENKTWSILLLVSISYFTIFSMIFYMIKKKVIFITYKISPNKILNSLTFFFLHNWFQYLLQMYSFAIFDS